MPIPVEGALHRKLFPPGGGLMKQYPWLYPPPGFLHVDRNRAGTVGATTVATLETIQLTQGYVGWITYCGLFASNYSSFFFQFQRGVQPIRDYERIVTPIGQPDLMQPIFLQISANEPLTLVATNTGGTVVGYRYRLFGWYYPEGSIA